MPAKYFFLALLALAWLQRGAWGHDLSASDATFWVRNSGIDVQLVMGLNSGEFLIAGEGETVVITPYNFHDFSSRLQAVGPGLFTLSAADGQSLNPDVCAVSITDQNDVRYDLHYPLPAAMPGTLTIHAAYVEKMADNHVGTIYVMNAAGDKLGWGEVKTDSMDVQAHLPAAGSLVKSQPRPAAAPVSSAAPTPASSTGRSDPSDQRNPWFLWVLLAASALIIAAVAWRTITRQNLDRGTNA